MRGGRATPFGTGLINDTFRVDTADEGYVVQRLHPVFSPTIHYDIDAVTRHLAGRGMVTPRLITADDGALWVEHDEAGDTRVWRAITFVPESHTYDRVPSPRVARAAGALVGRFHAALGDLAHEYQPRKTRPHDTARHFDTLEKALAEHREHRLFREVATLADELFARARPLRDFSAMPARHAHGDLKVSNVLFDARDEGLCLVDLDTVGRMPWAHEMGDALRSWCNPAGEDAREVELDVGLFAAAIEGYACAARGFVTPDERESLVEGLATITRELTARFLVDALREQYFGWDATRFATRGEHNLVRARGQWRLAESVRAQRGALDAIVRGVFG